MKNRAHILIIEDDADINEVVTSYLQSNGFRCTQAYSGSEAKLVLKQQASSKENAFDLILTDLMLPGMTGEEIVSLVRSASTVPIIVISAVHASTKKVEALSLGADDYLVKPFDLDELVARILAQLRRSSLSHGPSTQGLSAMSFGTWTLDTDQRIFSTSNNPIKLTRIEFNIIEALIRRPKKVFSKQELYEAAWDESFFVEESAINVHISNIRKKLQDAGAQDYIETVWGIGFKLTIKQDVSGQQGFASQS